MKAKNFLDYYESWHAAIRWATGHVGSRFVGVIATIANSVAEGSRQALYAGLPGHPEQANDAAEMAGYDRGLFRYRLETDDAWKERVRNVWTTAEQYGTKQAILSEVGIWGQTAFPAYWGSSPEPVLIHETGWASFDLTLPFGSTDWTTADTYDAGLTYDSGSVYDIGNANAEDLDHLRRLVRRVKPARSKATLQILLADVVFYDEGAIYDDGEIYAAPGDFLRLAL